MKSAIQSQRQTKNEAVQAFVRHVFIDQHLFFSFNATAKNPDKISVLKYHASGNKTWLEKENTSGTVPAVCATLAHVHPSCIRSIRKTIRIIWNCVETKKNCGEPFGLILSEKSPIPGSSSDLHDVRNRAIPNFRSSPIFIPGSRHELIDPLCSNLKASQDFCAEALQSK
uniref:Uncharacterized protein n=1 Tax=Salix viminalis TaxID=40686 RepID=A0A6N2LRQ7_SALVM